MKKLLSYLLLPLIILSCNAQQHDFTKLRTQLESVIASHNATIGLALKHIEHNDTLTVNNNHHYPMQSVYKFPLALYVLYLVDEGKLSLQQKTHISKEDVAANTWSPMKTKYPEGNVDVTLEDLLKYTVSGSDNIACDLLFHTVKGPNKVNNYIHKLGYKNIQLVSTEDQMHHDSVLQFKNTSTPIAMTELLTGFYKQYYLSNTSNELLLKLMIESSNSPQRIKGQLPAETIVAHKTGTGGEDYNNVRSACNDVGVITLPDGNHVALTLFVTQSKEPFEKDEQVMAQLSKLVYDFYARQ